MRSLPSRSCSAQMRKPRPFGRGIGLFEEGPSLAGAILEVGPARHAIVAAVAVAVVALRGRAGLAGVAGVTGAGYLGQFLSLQFTHCNTPVTRAVTLAANLRQQPRLG